MIQLIVHIIQPVANIHFIIVIMVMKCGPMVRIATNTIMPMNSMLMRIVPQIFLIFRDIGRVRIWVCASMYM